jgi:hypothetical protein
MDNTRAFIQAVIDNASRFILACNVAKDYGGLPTKDLLSRALDVSKTAGHDLVLPNVLCDSGIENLNSHVDALVEHQLIRRTVAQVDIAYSNSMIEAFFRRLKHAWLFTKALANLETVRRLTEVYVKDPNELIPHSVHAGATPAEVFFGQFTDENRAALIQAARAAKNHRAILNRSLACQRCAIHRMSPRPA